MVTGTADARPLGATGLVTEPAPTPAFRRFPWIQLAFCLACLAMAGWTWMRYSYAWDVTPVGLYGSECSVAAASYVRVWGKTRLDRLYVPTKAAPGAAYNVAVVDGDGQHEVFLTGVVDPRLRECWEGRLVWYYQTHKQTAGLSPFQPDYWQMPAIDVSASRFHPASVAGLVVGAMGCFIFGLYLRGWLRERKALASQPVQDMIA